MGRMLGAFADDEELDRPDLNKCPDCNCFFDGDTCPICKKICPEEMRAGNRPAPKPQRRKKTSSSGRVTFVEWYHSWWFIILMTFLFPIVGIILLITSPHKKTSKIIFVVIAIVYLLLSTYGISAIISDVTEMFDKPVNTSISREEYQKRCESVNPERLYRSFGSYEDKYVTFKVVIVEKVGCYDDYYKNLEDAYYLCEAEGGSSYKIIIRDCLIENKQNFIAGDAITVWGECDEEKTVYSMSSENYAEWEAPCVNVAYASVE